MGLIKQQPLATARMEDERDGARDLPGLIGQLDSPDPAVRRWAARDLAGHADAGDALVTRLRCDTDASVREVILTTLVRSADPRVIADLVECLRSEEAGLRNEVIEALKGMPAEIAPLMRSLLHDRDPDVRILAINVLESLRHPDVEQWLIAVIEEESNVNVCGTALDLLAEVGTPAARAPIERLRARFAAEPYIGFAASVALQRIGSG